MLTGLYTAGSVTLSAKRPHPGGGSQWDVYVGSTVVGTITSPQFGAYIGTVGECEIGAVYDTVSVAAAAVVTAHQRAAAL